MTSAGFTAAATVLSTTVAALQEEYCASAQAQTAPPESTILDHNGSVMYLVANGSSREIYYQKPRAGMLEVALIPVRFSSAAKSTTDNIWEQHIFLICIAGQFRTKLRDWFSTTMNGFC